MIAPLLLTLSACSTKTIVKTEHLTIPDKYLNGCSYGSFNPSEEAQEDASLRKDYKLFAIELTQYSLTLQAEIDRCNKNDESARRYQQEMKTNE